MKKKTDPKTFLKKAAPFILLIIIFSSALWVRSFPARFNEIQALDPFFFYRMGLEVMENGWVLGIDDMRYHPSGVDTAQFHYLLPIYLPAAVFALLSGLGMNIHYMNFAIMWPAVLGALAVIPMFFLGRELFNSDKAGLLAAFFLATIPAFITRTSAGFFEKEPIAGLFIITSIYFFIRAFKRSSWISGILGGVSIMLVSLAWGGVQYIFLLYSSFIMLIFVASLVLVFLDYMFTGFKSTLESLSKYLSMDMVKAYLPFVLLGTIVQAFFARHTELGGLYVLSLYVTLGILLLRVFAERFKWVKKENIGYIVPGTLVVLVMLFLIGSLFIQPLTSSMDQITNLVTFNRGVIGTTVAENAPGSWDNIAQTTGAGFAQAAFSSAGPGVSSFVSSIAPVLAVWVFMLLGLVLLLYRFVRTKEWLMLFPFIWLVSGMLGVFLYVRLIFLVGPPAALVAGFFVAWIIDRAMRTKYMSGLKKDFSFRKAIVNPIMLVLIVFIALVVSINFASAYAYSLNLGPSICVPRYNSNDPFDVVPCITIDENGNEVFSTNQPWYEAFTFMKEETPVGSSIISWWDFGYWFQTRGERPSIADGGNLGGQYGHTDYNLAEWFTDDTGNWDDHSELIEGRDADYVLMDYTLPGKYGAISKIASRGDEVIGMMQFSQKGTEQNGNQTVYIFGNGPYEIWLPLTPQGTLSGTPLFMIIENGQYIQRAYINDVCTRDGIVPAGSEDQSLPGCVSISDLGIYYIPPEAKNSIFTSLMFMNGAGLPVKNVYTNGYVTIYEIERDN